MRRLYVRILLWVLGLVVLAQLAVIAFFFLTRPRHGPPGLRTHVTALAHYLADDVGRAAAQGPGALAARLRALGDRVFLDLTLRDAAGQVVASAGDALPPPRTDVPVVDGARFTRLLAPDGARRPRFLVDVPWSGGTLSLSPRHPRWASHTAELVAAFAGLAVLVGLLLLPLARRITRPLRELEEAAHAIAEGDLGRRAQVRTKDEIGALAQTFNRMADRIAAALQQEKDLVTAISHELRAPLARVRMASELLADGAGLPPDAQQHLATIAEEVDALDALIDELLTRAKLESAGFEVERVPCDLAALAAEVRARALPVALRGTDAAAQRLVLTVPSGPVEVLGSKPLLARALRNLVENALQYSPPESRVEVEVSPGAVVRVTDHGLGIPAAELPRIFDPFFRGERSRSRRTGGVGFGLTLTREIVRRHGGEIAVESEVGRGTTVTVTLPARG